MLDFYYYYFSSTKTVPSIKHEISRIFLYDVKHKIKSH